jgi:hypothetical protein
VNVRALMRSAETRSKEPYRDKGGTEPKQPCEKQNARRGGRFVK